MSPQQKKFRIAWKSLITNAQGHGAYCFLKKNLVQDFAFQMNNEMLLVFHWVQQK